MQLLKEALSRFGAIYGRAAEAADVVDHTAVSLATCGATGWPQVRTVLLKGYDELGFTFYTNRHSRKGRALAENPRAALCFHWAPLAEQVVIEGVVTPVAESEADAYWASRPRESQIGGWASQQSAALETREVLEQRVAEYAARFPEGEPVPRPPHWSGYRLAPVRIEFWRARPGRLHERDVYEHTAEGWAYRLLNP
ncbi:pyridoxamine 5'-phosphate oxidase [Alkalispirillum mobile]|uniref:Pyridoxine/pyridoxamine 5'-phosphate oxidase n=1 Tax=Alkalispirillum mobile TaxID=85925 RepID=A0A498C708_9GAMM|nr:pyridoxamine 5'-phosphate oxidase [Alkalispirillum mobile]RLK50847.1 pyridoxamine 5'-phosphate oxidase [Alkalispirillum mobile]